MNWGQFKDPVYHLCLAGAIVASWSLTLETAGLTSFKNNFWSLNSLKTFRENSNNPQKSYKYICRFNVLMYNVSCVQMMKS